MAEESTCSSTMQPPGRCPLTCDANCLTAGDGHTARPLADCSSFSSAVDTGRTSTGRQLLLLLLGAAAGCPPGTKQLRTGGNGVLNAAASASSSVVREASLLPSRASAMSRSDSAVLVHKRSSSTCRRHTSTWGQRAVSQAVAQDTRMHGTEGCNLSSQSCCMG
jgi:hypothetical protein